jgi:hypothetical protein
MSSENYNYFGEVPQGATSEIVPFVTESYWLQAPMH